MSDPTMFGIQKAQWEVIAAIATSLSAIASFATVWVALHLAKRVSTQKVKFRISHRILVTTGQRGPSPEYVCFSVVNIGERPVRITSLGWQMGLVGKRYFIQTFDRSLSSALPVELAHGQEATYLIPFDLPDTSWLTEFARKMLPNKRTSAWTLRATLATSLGNDFKVRPDSSLRKKLERESDRISSVAVAERGGHQ